MSLPAVPFEGDGADDDGFDGQRGALQHLADLLEDTAGHLADDEQVYQPVEKVTRRLSGDARFSRWGLRLNRASARRCALRFGRNTPGIPPSRAAPPGRNAHVRVHLHAPPW